MKKTQRVERTTAFAFGEGESEQIFLKYLVSKYSCGKTTVTVHNAGGKNVEYILEKAVRVRGGFPYSKSFILLDIDRGLPKESTLILICSTPCLEGLFLSLLCPKVDYDSWSSDKCKRYFEKNYLGTKRIITNKDCEKLFPKIVLDKAREKNQTLKQIIDIFEGNSE